jgi:hypothetical protein
MPSHLLLFFHVDTTAPGADSTIATLPLQQQHQQAPLSSEVLVTNTLGVAVTLAGVMPWSVDEASRMGAQATAAAARASPRRGSSTTATVSSDGAAVTASAAAAAAVPRVAAAAAAQWHEGFLCPDCHCDLGSPDALLCHYMEEHSYSTSGSNSVGGATNSSWTHGEPRTHPHTLFNA